MKRKEIEYKVKIIAGLPRGPTEPGFWIILLPFIY